VSEATNSDKHLVSETVLFTVLEPAGEAALAAGATHEQNTLALPLKRIDIRHEGKKVTVRIKKTHRLPASPCNAVLNVTDDPGPVHATDCGSLGYARIRFKLEGATAWEEEETLCLQATKNNYELHVTVPDR